MNKEAMFLQPEKTVEKPMQIQEQIERRSIEVLPEMLENYNSIHENPELGGQEFETAKKVKEYLEKLNIEILGEGIGGAGLVARIAGDKNGPTIALRADMDALLVEEDKNNSPRSNKDGVMHACGHDLHTVGLMGGAKIINELAQAGELPGNVILLFQSNEDQAISKQSGAVQIVKFLEKSGLRSDIKAFFAMHAFSMLERGEVVLADKRQTAGIGFVDVKLSARGGHGIDIKTLPDIDYMLSAMKLKIADEFENNWLKGEGIIDSMAPKTDFKAENIMLSAGERKWVLRITAENYKEVSVEAIAKIKEIAQQVIDSHLSAVKSRIDATGAKRSDEDLVVNVEIKSKQNYRPIMHRDQDLVGVANDTAAEMLPNFQRHNRDIPAGEDFSFYLEDFRGQEIPGVFMLVGAANSAKGYEKKPHHSSVFSVDPEVTKDLAGLHADFAVRALEYLKKKK